MKQRFWLFLLKISKTPEGVLLPRWLLLARFILFPIDYIFWHHSKKVGYQIESDTWLIEGIKYSGKLMRHFAYGSDEVFRIVSRGDESITIERIEVDIDLLTDDILDRNLLQ